VQWVEHVDLEKDLIAHAVSKERHAFDECDVANIDRLAIVGIAPV
jgi:hypothetical protein